MSIRLGIYEVFSRIIPGGFYIAAIVQLLTTLGIIAVDWQTISDLSLGASVAFVVVAYVLGGALDNVSLVFFRLFKRPGLSGRSFREFKEHNKHRWTIDFEDQDWPILLAFIRTKNLDLAGEIDRQNALSIMLRNVGLGLLLMITNCVIEFFLSQDWLFVLAAVLLLIVAVLIMREAVKFRKWFYSTILETVLAYRLDLENSIKPVEKKNPRGTRK
ncbi:MAG: hypothetical protein AB1649_19200 [Chloroflexota bacterium]